MRQDVEAAGVVLVRDGRVLCLRNRERKDWGLPKGHRERGEDLLATARREVAEETGIADLSIVPGFRHVLRYPVGTRDGSTADKRVTYYLGRSRTSKVKLSDEHDEHRWVSADDAAELLPHESLRRIVREALRYLRGLEP